MAVVNQAFARHVLRRAVADRPAADRRSAAERTSSSASIEIVGVAADAKYTDLRSVAPPTIYFPARQRVDGEANFAVRVGRRRAQTAPS